MFLKSRSEVCEGRMEALHHIPYHLWVYIRDDGYNQIFKGKIAYLQLNLGLFRDSDFLNT